MIPISLVVRLVLVVSVMIGLATVAVVGRPRSLPGRFRLRERRRSLAPSLALLGAVLAVNVVARRVGPDLSWLIGWNVTAAIYRIEGAFVAELQTFATPSLTAYFSFAYLYGYVFLLVFPFVAYAALEDLRPFRETATAYSVNYAIGLACYLLLIAHGPRNYVVGEPLLYNNWPLSQLLTSQVNAETNVFPSLHTSLSLTVAMLAYRTRASYPRWLYLALPLAASVSLSTMYLGIHWGTDVVAGGLLAVVSVAVASRTGGPTVPPRIEDARPE